MLSRVGNGYYAWNLQRQSPEVSYKMMVLKILQNVQFCKIDVLKNLAKFTGKHLCQSLLFNKIAALCATSLKKRFWHRRFPVNFARFLRTPFLQNISGQLLLIRSTLNVNPLCTNDPHNGKSSHRRCYIKKAVYKNSLDSNAGVFLRILGTPILKNICKRQLLLWVFPAFSR